MIRAPWPHAVRWRMTLAACSVFLAMASIAAVHARGTQKQAATKTRLGQISGHVLRSDNSAPIAKAIVSLYSQDANREDGATIPRVTRSTSDGAFSFVDVPPGNYEISAWSNSFARSRIQWEPEFSRISLQPGQKIDNFEVRLMPSGVISGTLVDEDQDPVAGVNVEVVRIHFAPGGRRQIFLTSNAISNDLGNFRIPALLPGTYFVRAGGNVQMTREQLPLKTGPGGGLQYRETYFPGTAQLDEAQPVEVRPGEESANIRIPIVTQRTYSIVGSIVGTPEGSNLKPTELRVERRGTAYQMWNVGGYWITKDGSYSMHMLPPGDYTLTALAIKADKKNEPAQEIDEGFASVRIVDSDVRADIQLGRAGEIRGTAEAPAGFSFAGKSIILQSRGLAYFPAAVDSAGRFDGRNIPPGEYTIDLLDRRLPVPAAYITHAVCSGQDITLQPVELTLDAVLDCKVTIADDTASVSGHVSDRDLSAASVVVVLIPQSPVLRRLHRHTLTAKTDKDGQFKLAGAIPGDYLLFAVPPSDDSAYFALDFADRNQASAVSLNLGPRAALTKDLKLTTVH